MPNLSCRCGYIHNLSLIPDEGWRTIRDEQYDDFVNCELVRDKLAMADEGTKEFEQLIKADAGVSSMLGYLYQCPKCSRIMWQKPDSDHFVVFQREDNNPNE